MAKKILTINGPANIDIVNVKLGTDVRDDLGNIIGKVIRYFPESGRIDIEVDDLSAAYKQTNININQIISSHGTT